MPDTVAPTIGSPWLSRYGKFVNAEMPARFAAQAAPPQSDRTDHSGCDDEHGLRYLFSTSRRSHCGLADPRPSRPGIKPPLAAHPLFSRLSRSTCWHSGPRDLRTSRMLRRTATQSARPA